MVLLYFYLDMKKNIKKCLVIKNNDINLQYEKK